MQAGEDFQDFLSRRLNELGKQIVAAHFLALGQRGPAQRDIVGALPGSLLKENGDAQSPRDVPLKPQAFGWQQISPTSSGATTPPQPVTEVLEEVSSPPARPSPPAPAAPPERPARGPSHSLLLPHNILSAKAAENLDLTPSAEDNETTDGVPEPVHTPPSVYREGATSSRRSRQDAEVGSQIQKMSHGSAWSRQSNQDGEVDDLMVGVVSAPAREIQLNGDNGKKRVSRSSMRSVRNSFVTVRSGHDDLIMRAARTSGRSRGSFVFAEALSNTLSSLGDSAVGDWPFSGAHLQMGPSRSFSLPQKQGYLASPRGSAVLEIPSATAPSPRGSLSQMRTRGSTSDQEGSTPSSACNRSIAATRASFGDEPFGGALSHKIRGSAGDGFGGLAKKTQKALATLSFANTGTEREPAAGCESRKMTTFLVPGDNRHHDDDDDSEDDDDVFDVCSVFKLKPENTKKSARAPSQLDHAQMNAQLFNKESRSFGEVPDSSEPSGWQNRIGIAQNSFAHLIWGFIFGFMFVAWDTITVPLQLFDPGPSTFTLIIANLARIYWTLDIAVQFVTLRPDAEKTSAPFRERAIEYLRTWFAFDFLIVSVDWIDVCIALAMSTGNDSSSSAFAFFRVLRIFRLLRLIRLLKNAPEFTRSVAYYVRSDALFVFLGVARIMAFVVVITHTIACGWYGVGKYGHGGGRSWVELLEVDDQPLGTRYLSSFFWCLVAFTGTGALAPQNNAELLFGVFVLLTAFLVSVSIVSSLTTLMSRLAMATAKQAQQFSVLHRYLIDHGISGLLASRVERNAQYAMAEMVKNTTESSVELLQIISNPLRVELHYEVFSPLLLQHPFFHEYDQTNAPAMRQVTHQAIEELQVSSGDIIFSSGELLDEPDMFFIKKGTLEYLLPSHPKKEIHAGGWICEPVLWVDCWIHHGVLRARSECQLCLLCASRFQATATQFKSKEFYSAKYGNAFVLELNKVNREMLSEVAESMMNIEEIAQCVFPKKASHRSSQKSSKKLHLFKKGMSRVWSTGHEHEDEGTRSSNICRSTSMHSLPTSRSDDSGTTSTSNRNTLGWGLDSTSSSKMRRSTTTPL